MPNPSFFTFPNFSGSQEKSGCLVDDAGVKFPLVRFQDEVIQGRLTGLSQTYLNNAVIGGKITFPLMAAANGWGGAITGASLFTNNTILSNDTISLLLFSKDLTSSIGDTSNINSIVLTDSECEGYLGLIPFANPIVMNGKTLFSANSLNFKYVCDTSSLFGILLLNAGSSRTFSNTKFTVSLQITKS